MSHLRALGVVVAYCLIAESKQIKFLDDKKLRNPVLYQSIILFLGMSLSCFAFANKAVDLYSASVLVVNQTAEVRRKAAKDALANVIVKMSGSRQALDHPDVRKAINNASQYLYQYSYQTTDRTITIAGAEQPANRLLMRFNPGPLERLLRNAQQPIWSSNRPDILVWLAINDGRQEFVSAGSQMGLAMKTAANKRGIPIVNPVLDLEDRSALSVSRLWAMDEGSIRVASQRYTTQGILAGRIQKNRNQWLGRFIFLHQGKTEYFTATGGKLSVVADSIIGQITDYFANIYSVVPQVLSHQEGVLIQINNVTDFTRYSAIISYLENLPTVRSLLVTHVNRELLQIRLVLNTDLDRFLNILKLERKLQNLNKASSSQQPLKELSVSLTSGAVGTVVSAPLEEQALEFLWR
jgi:hypothetical protein